MMPWSLRNPPPPAKNWDAESKRKCIEAGNAVLREGGSEQDAIRACIRNAGKAKHSEESSEQFGGPGSGHWAHKGTPGRGGSAPGGGLSLIGARPGASREERVALSREAREKRKGKAEEVQRDYKTISHPNDAREYADRAFEGFEDSLSKGEEKALLRYQRDDGTYIPLNEKLRAGQDISEFSDLMPDLDAATRRGNLPDDLNLWRGTSADGIFSDPGSLVGKTLTDRGLCSTSISSDRAAGWARVREREGANPLLVKIEAPSGTRGAFMEYIGGTKNVPEQWSSEFEFLLPRDSKFRVTSYRPPSEPYFLMPETERYGVLTVELTQ